MIGIKTLPSEAVSAAAEPEIPPRPDPSVREMLKDVGFKSKKKYLAKI
ncbi:MAG: hypothetical protein WC151_12550 [Bacteroidales bacterium]|jgi:hypothetical protein